MRSPSRDTCRQAFTLLEVCLVLAILIVVAAITVPALQGTLARASLENSGDLLRAAWSKARLNAMESGNIHVFRFEPNGRRFQIVALDALAAGMANDLPPAVEDDEPITSQTISLADSSLPRGAIFSSGDISNSSQLLATMPGASDGPWSQPVLFYPDGTATDASLVLTNDQQISIRVTLRGLTGTANVADAETMVEVSP